MGAVFSLPWARLDDWRETPQMLSAAGFLTVALSLAPDAVELSQLAASITPQARLAVMLGTEEEDSRSAGRIAPRYGLASRCLQGSIHSTWLRLQRSPATRCRLGGHWPVVGIEVGGILVQRVELLASPP